MKHLFTFLFACIYAYNAAGQVSVTTDGSTPHGSAMLDIKSSEKGMLVPRMSSNLRSNIVNPADGLMVYDTDTKSFWFFKGGAGWTNTGGASLWATSNGFVYNANVANIGINTITPSRIFTVKQGGIGITQESPDGNKQIGFYTDDGSTWLQTHKKSNINFTTNNGNTKMILDTLDNVGIGNFDFQVPQARLDVKGNANLNNAIVVSHGNSNNGTGVTDAVTGLQAELTAVSGGGYSAALRGINRSTTNNGIGVVGYQAGSGWGVYGDATAGRGVFGTTNTGTGGFFTSTGTGLALQTSGKLLLQNNGEGTGKVLTSDANGNASWQTPATTVRSHTLVLGPSSFFGREDVYVRKNLSNGGVYFNAAVTNGQLYAPLTLPVGASITSITFWYVDNSTNNYSFAINREWSAGSGFNTQVISLSSAGANANITSLSHTFTTPHVVSNGSSYYVTMYGTFTGNDDDAHLKSVIVNYNY